MKVHSFSHVAITVSDFDEAVRFYWETFGCPVVGVSDTPTHRVRTFFGVDAPEPTCRIGWIRVPGGATIEIFEFDPRQPAADVAWNRVGMTHISFNVRDTHAWHAYLAGRGVEIVSRPEQSPHGQFFFFVKDPDGNLIELIDLRHMRPVLKWLGPLGGLVFRHSLYRRHYRTKSATR
ncbi:VOC family protein [Pedococcus sp. 5OH_020]|uniref:VOC family protein n=1 Tax=Pedococcus sp. 5OH_020 TaxID=2989814 RepID=UPI0022E9E9C9|nr:VOC family protein [Pedococcus sp. 5OH_020]